MLINSIELLKEARKNKKRVVAFNVYNLETIQAAFIASKNKQLPLILAFGEGYLKYTPFEIIVAMVKALDMSHPYPVVLHLDHCKSFHNIKMAIEAGFTSVMYDGSHLTFEENIKTTKEVVNYAHDRGIGVEGELGYMNPEDGSEAEGILVETYTSPFQAKIYIEQTKVDTLAVAIGNAHGVYIKKPVLDLERLKAIYQEAGVPIVLHGCSGIDQEQISKAVEIAVVKINVNTEIALTGGRRIRELLEEKAGVDVRLETLMEAVQQAMVNTMESFL
ncbi:class II fructose-bisphosphate aldolase [Geosporobacter ferrireducens]|uniref:Fructose-bisphosphate aldolase n=1 Tax=Geosporobacter ferrireducens TaxID=1424294 RepID=A0A1D8GMD0_9FIRM|nr:class II fructose-bisphosphate aldolase [Geosporobacter ferrireducens]AOT72083.1 hypothetical protein Gferi_22610 [Geosporobacter ferrireducens]MTI55967.1 class II fructose-bisphosphate aldolase [Geosporobacter ferrireducens]